MVAKLRAFTRSRLNILADEEVEVLDGSSKENPALLHEDATVQGAVRKCSMFPPKNITKRKKTNN